MKLQSLLVTPERDYVISSNGVKVNVDELDHKLVCLYFATSSSESLIDSPNTRCRDFTGVLRKVYSEMRAENDDFEIVLVSLDRDPESFEAHFEKMPWLAIPYWDTSARSKLRDELNVEVLPRLVVFDKEGHLWHFNGYELVTEHGAEAFSSKFMSKSGSLESLFGSRNTLLKHHLQEVKIADIRGKTIGLFFSAHCSRRARSFTHKLIKVYEDVRARGEEFEIIFISSDHDLESFTAYYGTMPWLAVAFEDISSRSSLISRFQVQEVPHLIILDAHGGVVTGDGCLLVLEYGSSAFPFTRSRIPALRSLNPDKLSSEPEHRQGHDHHPGTQIWITNNPQPGLNQCGVCKRFGSGWTHICKECESSRSRRRAPRDRPESGDDDFQDDYTSDSVELKSSKRRQKPWSSVGSWVDSETKRTLIGSLIAGLFTAVVGVCSFCCSKQNSRDV